MSLLAENPLIVLVLSFALAGLIALGGKKGVFATQWFAVIAPVSAALAGLGVLASGLATPPTDVAWLAQGGRAVAAGLSIDNLSAIMLLVVGVVASCVVVFSIGYMAEDDARPRYFALLALFTGAMSMLVMASSLVTLFIGWELVGACSYLLIGFWYRKPSASAAAVKAFLTTRIGDVGMLLGLALLWKQTGSFSIPEVLSAVPALGAGTVTLVALLLFVGAAGKSAQFPLHIWLPDAMEGPTPVSALIHAATMVAAGVFLLARMWPVFDASAVARDVVLVIGTLTAVFAATIACVQLDIKKVLAYSTISQLGFMFAALGAGAWGAAMFHLTTHAAFKALLFLGSGSVIHATETQDIREMGGLLKKMPGTGATWLVGVWALSGLPLLSGFFSKDGVLASVLHGAPIAGYVLVAASLLTAFYAFRVTWFVFFGAYRGSAHPHEGGLVMTAPLVALALPAIALGYFSAPFMHSLHLEAEALDPVVAGVSVAVAVIGVLLAVALYRRGVESLEAERTKLGPAHAVLFNAYGVDAFVARFLVAPLERAASWSYEFVDRKVIDGAAEGAGKLSQLLGRFAVGLQTGETDVYASLLGVGFVVLMGVAIWLGR
jgi:NADH-quinone oxidoreductase subunit L